MDRLLTVQEVAEILRVSESTVYRYCWRGLLPYKKVGSRIRIRQSYLEAFIEHGGRKAVLADYILKKVLTIQAPVDIEEVKGGKSKLAKKGQTCFNYGYGRLYARKTKQNILRWYVDYRGADGRRIRKVVKEATSREHAHAALKNEVLKTFSQKRGVECRNERIGFSEFAHIYLEDYIKVSRRNCKSDLYRLEMMKDYFGNTELRKITPIMIEKFRATRLKAGNSRSTTNRYLALMKKLFSLAAEEGYVEANPVKKVRFYSEKDSLKETILSEEDESKLLLECSERLRPVVLIALHTGMRKSEVLGLKWESVDFKRKLIKVERSKSGSVRFIPMNDAVYEEFLSLRKRNPSKELVFPYKSLRTAFENARKRAGLKVRFHDLRHTFATRLIERGADIETVRSLLGHSSFVVTQRYTHSSDERKRQAVGLLLEKKNAESQAFLTHRRHTAEEKILERLPTYLFSMN